MKNKKLFIFILTLVGFVIGALAGKAFFNMEEAWSWSAIMESGGGDHALEYFLEETGGPLKLGGGGIVGAILGFGIGKFMKNRD